jgi:hypothetical protein
MKKNKAKRFFILILFAHILVCFLKIDRDVFVFQEYICRPQQTYTERPLCRNVLYCRISASDFYQFSRLLVTEIYTANCISAWRSMVVSHNVRVHRLLRCQKIFVAPISKTVSVLLRKNICHKSSENDAAA